MQKHQVIIVHIHHDDNLKHKWTLQSDNFKKEKGIHEERN